MLSVNSLEPGPRFRMRRSREMACQVTGLSRMPSGVAMTTALVPSSMQIRSFARRVGSARNGLENKGGFQLLEPAIPDTFSPR
jgi:hypothetical protein